MEQATTNSEKVVVSLKKNKPRAMENELLVNQSLLAAFMFMDFWPRLELLQRQPLNSKLVEQNLCSLQRALNQIGPWAKLIARPLALGMMTMHPQIASLQTVASAEKEAGYGSMAAVAFALKRLSRGENIC